MRLKKDKDKDDKLKRFLTYKNQIKQLQIEKEKDKELRKLKKLQQNFENNGISLDAQKTLRPTIMYEHEHFSKDMKNNKYLCDVDNEDEHMANYEKEDIYLKNIGINQKKIKKVFENDFYTIDKI